MRCFASSVLLCVVLLAITPVISVLPGSGGLPLVSDAQAVEWGTCCRMGNPGCCLFYAVQLWFAGLGPFPSVPGGPQTY